MFRIPLEGDRLTVPCDFRRLLRDAGHKHFRLVFRPELQIRTEVGRVSVDVTCRSKQMDEAACADRELAEHVAAVVGFRETVLNCARIDGG